MTFVDLSRRFRDLTQSELEAPELLASFNDSALLAPAGWPEILKHPRVVLLAEAGSGKTVEMREQARQLSAEGNPAFFVALESLDRESLPDLLSPDEEVALQAWRADDHSTAWFLLDAVDELKLTHGKFERALGRLARATDGLLHRMHVVISCRPYDWRPSLDLATVQAKLPITPTSPRTPPSSDETFLAALSNQEDGPKPEAETTASADSPRVVVLLPLSEQQIQTFARSLGVNDEAAFIAEIRKQNAWTFARRPLDLSELVTTWKAHGRLGTRAEQHESNVTAKLTDDPDRPDRGVLSDARARLGAERLALALALTRTRTIRSPEQAPDAERVEGVLDAALILTDWTEYERRTLLSRALFDPATYGRIRFHHRTVHEYLAARRLRALCERGMPVKALLRLLFAERYGVPVVIPSMQAIAAWLALWDENVRRELMTREPETLLSMGDPESLPVAARGQLLRAFADAYGEGGWRGLDIPIDEIRRLAHPELAEVIRDLWGDGPANDDVRELLLEMIWQGPIDGCADIVEHVAYAVDLPANERITAIRALLACDRTDIARKVVESMIDEPAPWPDRIVHGVAADLFPRVMSVAELIALVERTREPRNTVEGFTWAMRRIAELVEPWSETGVELRDALADLIWRGRHAELEWYRIRGRFDHVAPTLARLTCRQLSTDPGRHDSDLIRAAVIANRFGDDETGAGDFIRGLKQQFQEDVVLRAAAFRSELTVMNDIAPTTDGWERYVRATHHSILEYLNEGDRAWLETGLRDPSDPECRVVALYVLISLWAQRGRSEVELDELRNAVKDDADLARTLAERTAPPKPDAQLTRMERRQRRRQCIRKRREQQRLADWTDWRDELLANSDAAFGPENLRVTVSNLYKWLNMRDGSRNRYNVWNADALRQAFGDDIARRATAAFQAAWRAEQPMLWSQRPPGQRNSTPVAWIHGLCGLAAEAMSPGWAARLPPEESRLAATYATVEINGFPAWLKDLAAAHPAEVEAVLGGELIAELAVGVEHSHLPTLQDLTYADHDVKRLLAPRLLARLAAWPSPGPDEEAGRRWAHHLDQVLRVLDETSDSQDQESIVSACEVRFTDDPSGPLARTWLRGLFRFHPERAATALGDGLAMIPEAERAPHAVGVFAGLFGDRDNLLRGFADDAARAFVLSSLVRCAYTYILPEDDQEHEGPYTPDTRDRAEIARNFLLSALLDTPGSETHRVLHELAADPLFAHFPERLRLLARHRAASDADGALMRPADIATLEERYEALPHDRDGLFATMIDRLDDLAHDIAHDDFTDRRTLRAITDESEMQRTLARRLRDAARGAYVVVREDEVADQKRTDIRLAAVRGEQKATIEVKIADRRWTLKKLERALRNQLVGQYLRHENCKAGCLLLTYDGSKGYWQHPTTRAHLNFEQLVSYLGGVAKEIERELAYGVRLAVSGLDLTDPALAPAHG